MICLLVVLLLLFSPIGAHAYTLDAYGGINEINCPSGSASHFYPEKIGNRWLLCTPAGHGFFMMGVTVINTSPATANFQTKYGSYTGNDAYLVVGVHNAAGRYHYNWALNAVSKLKAWGFDFAADGADPTLWPTQVDTNWTTGDQTIPVGYQMPFDLGSSTTRYALSPTGPPNCSTTYPTKDMVLSITSAYGGTIYNTADYFDPHWPTCAVILVDNYLNPFVGAPNSGYLMYFTIDEGDQTGGILGTGWYSTFTSININNGTPTGSGVYSGHAGWVTLSADPIQFERRTLTPQIYTDAEVYGKVEIANELANEYVCTGSGTSLNGALACCTGAGTGTCSVDPASASYIGAPNDVSGIALLNTAWASYYTTFGTSDTTNCGANLATCLSSGTYGMWGDHFDTATCSGTSCSGTMTRTTCSNAACSSTHTGSIDQTSDRSYILPVFISTDLGSIIAQTNGSSGITGTGVSGTGTITPASGAWSFTATVSGKTVDIASRTLANSIGTGVLDEDGSCPARGAHACWMGDGTTLVGETTAMKADLDHFLFEYASRYLSTLCGETHTKIPGLMCEMDMGGYGNPPRKPVLQAAGLYMDLPGMDEVPPYCPTCTDVQQRLDAIGAGLGDRPFKNWEGWSANPDSAMSANVREDISTTQGGRGTAYAGMVNLLVNSKYTAYNDYPAIGFYWWDWYDSPGEGRNWGLVSPSDNIYDGIESVMGSVTCSAPSASYTCGGEAANYGNFISSVATANQAALTTIFDEQIATTNGVHVGLGFW